MTKHTYLQKDYTLFQDSYQLKLPLNIECMISADDPVRLLSRFVEGMDLRDLYATYSRIRKNQASPRQLFKIILYAYMNRLYSSRDIERACRKDIGFMYLLEGMPVPDHTTIARFRSLHFSAVAQSKLSEMSGMLFDLNEISGHDIFIDGTKIEAASNKYTFVWKKAVNKNMAKLLQKAADLVAECEELYGIRIIYKKQVKLKHLKNLLKKLTKIKKEENIIFVHGSGKRKTPLQKSIETLREYISRIKDYVKKLYICGNRNSYSKTDNDATFMRMKDDAMRNGQLKPGYNLQHGVDSEYIIWVTVGPQPTDTTTLIPFIKSMENSLRFKYRNIIADAGYESEENYLFIEENGQTAFIKPANYEISKTRKFKKDISRIENMEYLESGECFVCSEGRILWHSKDVKSRTKTGYQKMTSIYTCESCEECKKKRECIKGNNSKTPFEERTKNLYVSHRFQEQRKNQLARITTEEGCRLRMNRSIQVEGSFGNIKQDMGFRRYLCRGTDNVLAESILVAMAHNINKLHHKIQSNRTGTHLFALKTA